MAQPFHTELAVPVAGGSLVVGHAGPPPGTPGVPVVLAVHGITGSYRTWVPTARHLGDDVTLLAPDLRGRGGSSGVGGPFGMAAHVADLVAVLDHVGCERAVLAGHSMGAYIVGRLAVAEPGRLAASVLVDGGLPLPVPADVDPDVLIAAVLGPSLVRLQRTFPSLDAYLDFWRAHPALARAEDWTEDLLGFLEYDLAPPTTGPAGEAVYRSRVSEAAVLADGRDVLAGEDARKALPSLVAPAVLLWAPRGIQNEDQPLLPADAIAEAQAARPDLEVVLVPDTNHYLILLGPREAAAVAGAIRRVATS